MPNTISNILFRVGQGLMIMAFVGSIFQAVSSLDVELSGGFFESLMYILLAILGGAMGVFMFPPWSYLFFASIAALIVCAFTKKADGEETD